MVVVVSWLGKKGISVNMVVMFGLWRCYYSVIGL